MGNAFEDGDDNGDEDGSINVGGKNLKSNADIRDCIKEQTGYDGKMVLQKKINKNFGYI